MKANALIASALLALFVAGCSSAPKERPKHHPRPVEPVTRPVKPDRPPVSVRPAPGDWRDQPRTAGDWRWRVEGARSVASYGSVFAIACNATQRALTLEIATPASANQIVMITTTSQRRALGVQAAGQIATASLAAGDPLIDAMAFSRGRFMVESGAMTPLYLPSWPEITRVTEDCR
ncbi:MAG: hypothetical protein ACKOPO_01225 [Novosphingobium sp.]